MAKGNGAARALSIAMASLAGVLVLVGVAFISTNSVVVLKGVSRISIFDQWSEPADAAGQNPSIVRFAQKDMERTRDKCIAKCQVRPGYNPSKDDIEICERYCHRVADDVTPFENTPKPAQHSWWSRVAPDGQEYRYLKNEKASAGFDPAARPQLKHSHKTILAKHDAHRAGAKKAGVSMLLQTSAQTESGHGLDQISFSHENALSEMSDYFDSLPTKDCAHPDCNYEDKVQKLRKVLVKKGEKFTTKDIKHYEKTVLGYHRRHEKALEAGELKKIGAESDRMMANSINGYNRLEAEAQARHPAAKAPNMGQHPRARHSSAYLKAKQAPGFVGYNYNVFAEKENQQPVVEYPEVQQGAAKKAVHNGARNGGETAEQWQRTHADHDARLKMDEAALAQMQRRVQALEKANGNLQDVSSALSKVVLASKQQASDGPTQQEEQQQGGGAGAGAAAAAAAGVQEEGGQEGRQAVGELERHVLMRTEGTLQRQLSVLRSHLAAAQAADARMARERRSRVGTAGREAAVRELKEADDALLQRKLDQLTRKAKAEQASLMHVLDEPAPTQAEQDEAQTQNLLGYSPRKVAHLENREWSQIKKESSF